MSKIKNTKQFKEQVDAAFETQTARDEANAPSQANPVRVKRTLELIVEVA